MEEIPESHFPLHARGCITVDEPDKAFYVSAWTCRINVHLRLGKRRWKLAHRPTVLARINRDGITKSSVLLCIKSLLSICPQARLTTTIL